MLAPVYEGKAHVGQKQKIDTTQTSIHTPLKLHLFHNERMAQSIESAI
jgi:hypothetical protein